jgi:hypothetical protein
MLGVTFVRKRSLENLIHQFGLPGYRDIDEDYLSFTMADVFPTNFNKKIPLPPVL